MMAGYGRTRLGELICGGVRRVLILY